MSIRQTGRKVIAVLLALAVAAAFWPAAAHAESGSATAARAAAGSTAAGSTAAARATSASTEAARAAGTGAALRAQKGTPPEIVRGLVIRGKVIKGRRFRGTDGEMAATRQQVMETLEAYYESVGKREHYHKDVWDEINRNYNNVRSAVENAQSGETLIYGYIMGFALLREDLSIQLERVATLSTVTKQVYNGRKDYPALQKALRKELKANKALFAREDYNDYYWDVYLDRCAEAEDLVNAMTDKKTAKRISSAGSRIRPYDLRTYLSAAAAVSGILYLDIADVVEEEADDGNADAMEFIDEEDDPDEIFVSGLLWENLEWPVSDMYTNRAMDKLRKDYAGSLKRYARDAMPAYGYKGKPKDFDGIVRKYSKRIRKAHDAKTVVDLFIYGVDRIDRKSGIDFRKVKAAGWASKVRMRVRMKDYFLARYQEKDYTGKGWLKLRLVLKESRQEAADAMVEKQLSEKMFDAFRKRLQKVPTLAEERAGALKKARKEADRKLEGYRNAAFYDQKTAGPLLQKAREAAGKCTSAAQLKKTLKRYIDRLEKTRIRCKVTVEADGKGKVTGKRTARKGRTLRLKIKAGKSRRIKALFVDDKQVARATNMKKYTYSFRKISKDHTLRVEFY